jgi:histidinol dehydrogenase
MLDLAGPAALIARAEGLTAHARALELRLEGR